MSIELHFNNQEYIVKPGSFLHEYAESFGIHVPTSCQRQGKCKECLVEVIEGMEHLSGRVPQEEHLKGNFRLSCRTSIIAEKGTIRCNTMRRGNMKIETKGLDLPAYNKLEIKPAVTRDDNRILLDGIEISQSNEPIFGIAMDLGTTTIVMRLVNLETGEITAESSFENPQRFGDSDVMARIFYDTQNKGKLLQRTLAGYITHAIEEFPVNPGNIYEMIVAGNSTMRDIFFRLDVYSIGQNPYQSITEIEMKEGKRNCTSVSSTPKRLLLPIHPKARIYGLPVISGHVGADAAACMLAIDLANEKRIVSLMDIGTNTELILGSKDKIFAASCPAGPAFEGGNISCGMPGLPGAVEKVKINNDGSISLNVIDSAIPNGICGSGLIDLLGELLRTGKMNPLGRIIDDTGLQHNEDRITLYSDNEHEIYLNEKDINELAQAKGANAAGLHTVFNSYGISFEDADVFYLAGGFGRHLNIESAKRIGLIPNIADSKIVQIGNASIEGATIALLSTEKRKELEEMIKKVTHCRLETAPSFFDYFVEGCQFNPLDTYRDAV